MWSGMLLELLNMISRKYIVYYEDYLTFARVCKSWHSAAALGDYSNGPPSQFPSLLLAEKEDDGREFRKFFLLSNKSIRRFTRPQKSKWKYRSCMGWRQRDFYILHRFERYNKSRVKIVCIVDIPFRASPPYPLASTPLEEVEMKYFASHAEN
ncbi:hypothetical protein Tco_1079568 [Tanacetum coccineum]|uniref:F-box protein n=1 Tax=Tanacetum coccineum TaxID=301880 RepID=A0ABQ5HS64_9ASTR